MNRHDCPQCSTGCPGNNYNGYADPGAFGHCGCSCHHLLLPGLGRYATPTLTSASPMLVTAALDAVRVATPCAADCGTVYLLHFDRPYGHARHYTGWAIDLDARLAAHTAGRGARLMAVIHAAGIGWQLARTWTGTRAKERALKRQGGASRRCPLCGITPRRLADRYQNGGS